MDVVTPVLMIVVCTPFVSKLRLSFYISVDQWGMISRHPCRSTGFLAFSLAIAGVYAPQDGRKPTTLGVRPQLYLSRPTCRLLSLRLLKNYASMPSPQETPSSSGRRVGWAVSGGKPWCLVGLPDGETSTSFRFAGLWAWRLSGDGVMILIRRIFPICHSVFWTRNTLACLSEVGVDGTSTH